MHTEQGVQKMTTARKLTSFQMFSAINDERKRLKFSPLSQYEFPDRFATAATPSPELRKEFTRVMLNSQHDVCSW